MGIFTVREGTVSQRLTVSGLFRGLAALDPAYREKIITAWVTIWLESDYADLLDVPSLPSAPAYRLVDHVNEVLDVGFALAEQARKQWSLEIDSGQLAAVILLHDIDKPLLYRRERDAVAYTPVFREVAHGVLGAILLNQLDLPRAVIASVSTHALNAPFHGSDTLSYILHYADLFATDNALRAHGLDPLYQRMHLPR